MIDLEKLLAGSEYEEKTECLKEAFKTAGVIDLASLDNAPRLVGRQVCGLDIYSIVEFIRGRLVNPPATKRKRK